jgi:hypothetical protein
VGFDLRLGAVECRAVTTSLLMRLHRRPWRVDLGYGSVWLLSKRYQMGNQPPALPGYLLSAICFLLPLTSQPRFP